MCQEICDGLKEWCFDKTCVKIIRRIFEFIFLVIGTILLGLVIGSESYISYFIFLSIYGPFFYIIYYFPRCCLNSDCLDKCYKCKRNTYFLILFNASLFIIFIFAIIIWGIVNLSKYQKTNEKFDREKEPFKIDPDSYKSLLAEAIFGFIFTLFGMSSIVLEINYFKKEFLYYKSRVESDEKEKEKKALEENKENKIRNKDEIEVISVENNKKNDN